MSLPVLSVRAPDCEFVDLVYQTADCVVLYAGFSWVLNRTWIDGNTVHFMTPEKFMELELIGLEGNWIVCVDVEKTEVWITFLRRERLKNGVKLC